MSLIAIDMDGTLINNNHEISEENIKAIQRAQALGHEVVIATGRAHFDVAKILKKYGLSLYMIGANGATVHSPAGTNILTVPMNEGKTREIIPWFHEEGYYYELFCEDGIYTLTNSKEILLNELERFKPKVTEEEYLFMLNQYEKQTGQLGYVYMENYEKVYEDNQRIYNISAFSFDLDKLQVGWDKYKDDKDVTIVKSLKYNFELEHPNASKGQALVYLAKVLNLEMSPSLAIGDSGNDISMFNVVTDSVAMGNANEEVKSKANFVTAINDDNGVAKAIYRFLER